MLYNDRIKWWLKHKELTGVSLKNLDLYYQQQQQNVAAQGVVGAQGVGAARGAAAQGAAVRGGRGGQQQAKQQQQSNKANVIENLTLEYSLC